MGVHAGGVIFVDEPFTNTTSLMRAPDGTIVTAFDLHDSEECSLIKYDLLSVEAEDKIHICLDLLCDAGIIERKATLKETYESTVGIYNLERDDPEMWKMVWNHQVISLFQMEKQSGIQGIALTKPKSVEDLAHLNSVIRLMAQEKGGEQPLHKFARFKNDITQWYEEMDEYGLTRQEQDLLKPYLLSSYGIAESQESFMQLVQIPECGGFDLNWSDRLRKSIAKKNPAEFEKLEEEYFEQVKEKNLSKNLCNYVWKVLVSTSRGYGFNLSHTLAYSLVALQEMNLAYKYPTIYWNCACLINDSGSVGEDSSSNYDKMASAIGKMKEAGVQVSLPDINNSSFGFVPNAEENKIYFGLKGIANVNDGLANQIIENRPYNSMLDFYYRVNPNRKVMVELIKGGVFDSLGPRYRTMVEYIWETCDKKKRITMQNYSSLRKYDLIPQDSEEFVISSRVYEFNRYLKDTCKVGEYYQLDERAVNFLVSTNILDGIPVGYLMPVKDWNKTYQKYMDVFRNWMAENQEEILDALNTSIFLQDWEKYATGNLSAWEMEAVCFYAHEHELAHVNKFKYGLSDFYSLPEEPVVKDVIKRGDFTIPIYKLNCICGTCIAKNKAKGTVTLLTTDGVVPVKFRKEYFALFDKRISQRREDGTKKIVESSWFKRGEKILVSGIRRGNEFVAKKYASGGLEHQLYHIDSIDAEGNLELRSERYKGEEEQDDD